MLFYQNSTVCGVLTTSEKDNKELLKNVVYYLSNDKQREEIKNNSRIRCIEGNYSYEDRYKNFLEEL